MMQRFLRFAAALVLAAAIPLGSLAQHGGRPSGGGAHPAPAARPAAPARPQAAPVRPQAAPARPAAAPARPQGFSLPRDVNAPRPIQPTRVPRPMVRPIPQNYNGPHIANPRHWGRWGWNHGVAWYPAPIYWGGGFWGPFALGAFTGAILYGSIVDYPEQIIYPSYEAQPASAGATLLEDYGLTQTPCGPPNLVVIWGPGNSVVCAYPNNVVAAGTYDVDPSTLTLVTPPSQ